MKLTKPTTIKRSILASMTFALAIGNVSAAKLLLYSPGEKDGFHVAEQIADGSYRHIGQIFSSDYSQWGSEKRMYSPCIAKLAEGGYAAVFGVNDYAPCFAVAYSTDLITWRPQDYPRMSVKGCFAPVIRQDGNGKYTVLFKTKDGKVRKTSTSDKFHHFTTDVEGSTEEYNAAATKDVKATVDGKEVSGTLMDVDDALAANINNYFEQQAVSNKRAGENLADDSKTYAYLNGKTLDVTLHIDKDNSKKISDKLIGIFFEDISYAADGGLYAEMVQNRDFEYTPADHKGWTASTAWTSSNGKVETSTDNGLSQNNPNYAIVANESLTNEGWDGMVVKAGEKYDFSFFAQNIDGKQKTFVVSIKDGDKTIATATVKTKGRKGNWNKYEATLTATASADKATLTLASSDKAKAGVDMISLFPEETFCHRKNGLRKDLAQTIANLHPKFVRFPGGCMSHGDGLDNIYHWHHTIGNLEDRKPDRNIWHYHQTRGLGFYEYFQFCEDINAEPLPVLAAGVPCQNSAPDKDGYGGQQGGIPMEEMDEYIEEFLNLIEWANGDPTTSKWAKMRADAGHPAPFNLKYIGVGNEDIISTTFEDRCAMIAKAIKAKYPEIEVCGTAGPFHYPSSDYIEGWKYAKQNADVFDIIDEHYYESVGWFLNNQHYYDNYDRTAPKVYLGEYAARSRGGNIGAALAEAAYLCAIERNGDVVSMTSYAPMLCHTKHSNWDPDMIYFDNTSIRTTPSYETQRLFSEYGGDEYISTRLEIADSLAAHRIAASLVKNSKTGKQYLKLVNILPTEVSITISAPKLNVPQELSYEQINGKQGQANVTPEKGTISVAQDAKFAITLPPYTFRVVEL